MARISGVDLPKRKHIVISLRYLYGVGPTLARVICQRTGIAENRITEDLSDAEVKKIRDLLESEMKVEGDLRRDIHQNIKRLMDIRTYRGLRHLKGLPCRGQRTRTNSRTRKGKRKTMGGLTKKPVAK